MREVGESETNFSKYLLYGVVGVIWLWIAKDFDPWTLPVGWCVIFIIIFFYCVGELPFWISRYYMSWFICDGSQGSFNHNDSPLVISDSYINKEGKIIKFNWLVYALGASRFPFPMKGKIETVIIPETQVDRSSLNHKSNTKVSPIKFINLPPKIFEELRIRGNDFNLNNIKIGMHTTKFNFKEIDDINLSLEVEKANSQRNELSRMLDNKFDSYEKVKETFERLNPKPSFGDKISNILKRNPNADSGGN